MPVVTVSTLDLLTSQKKNISKEVTKIISEQTNVPEDRIYVFFGGYPLDSIAAGGVLNSDLPTKVLKNFVTKDIEAIRRSEYVSCIQRFEAVSNGEDTLRRWLNDYIYGLRLEEGCVQADLYQCMGNMTNQRIDDHIFMVKEIWKNNKSAKKYRHSDQYNSMIESVDVSITGSVDTYQCKGSDFITYSEVGQEVQLSLVFRPKEKHYQKVLEQIKGMMLNLKSKKGCQCCNLYISDKKQLDNRAEACGSVILDLMVQDSVSLNEMHVFELLKNLFNVEEQEEVIEVGHNQMVSLEVQDIKDNAVLGDAGLMAGLMQLNHDFGELCIAASGVPWGNKLLDQKTKVLIAIAVDVVEQITGKPFENHIAMARKQGITRAEIEELLLFMTIYAGFNKAGFFYSELNRIYKNEH